MSIELNNALLENLSNQSNAQQNPFSAMPEKADIEAFRQAMEWKSPEKTQEQGTKFFSKTFDVSQSITPQTGAVSNENAKISQHTPSQTEIRQASISQQGLADQKPPKLNDPPSSSDLLKDIFSSRMQTTQSVIGHDVPKQAQVLQEGQKVLNTETMPKATLTSMPEKSETTQSVVAHDVPNQAQILQEGQKVVNTETMPKATLTSMPEKSETTQSVVAHEIPKQAQVLQEGQKVLNTETMPKATLTSMPEKNEMTQFVVAHEIPKQAQVLQEGQKVLNTETMSKATLTSMPKKSEKVASSGKKVDNLIDKKEMSEKNVPTEPSGSALLESLFSTQKQQAPTTNATTNAQVVAQGSDTAELVDKLVDRILVSSPESGKSEIRIKLNDNVLRNTELSLLRSPDGQLTINLTSSDANAFQTMVSAQHSLQELLEQRGENVRIQVSSETGAGAEENNPQRRSQGYQEYQEQESFQKR